MKKILYIDCFSGISGDMMVGALIDLGIGLKYIISELKKIDLPGYDIKVDKLKVNAITSTKFDVIIKTKQPERNFKQIRSIIKNSSLNKSIIDLSLRIFEEIAKAEAKVHSHGIEDVHFHEIGALDSIIDIVSTAICLDKLEINLHSDLVCSREIPLGKGTASTIHGIIPVPAPATLEILKGLPVYGGNFDFEVTTPTGAAIVKTISKKFGEIPPMIIEKIGLGAGSRGSRKLTEIPNVLRLLKGSVSENEHCYRSVASENMLVMENLILVTTNIDDSTPEILSYLLEKIFRIKISDAWIEPVYMKKNRSAFKLCVLTYRVLLDEVLKLIFTESTTFGVRIEEVKRFALDRLIKTVKLPYGEVKIKIGKYKGKEITFSPEFESCAKLARKKGIPIKEVYRDAMFFLSSK
jgi:uncharacterized protein (TIGR00299 family) protein